MLGLFLLGMLSRRTGNRAAIVAVAAGFLAIGWMTFSPDWARFRSPFHDYLIAVFGTLMIFAVGFFAGFVWNSSKAAKKKIQ
jgi:SSS family solute:Na+ symporter